jgi:hypothetical protein
MQDSFSDATFADKVGQTFRVAIAQDQAIDVQLIDVRRMEAAVVNGAVRPTDRVPFALTFQGPATPRLPQQTYAFGHETLGTHDIFIVAIGINEQGLLYEAVFA